MAKKGQKYMDYPSNIKLEVASKVLDGRGHRSIAKDYKHDIIRIDEIVQKRISEFSQLQIVVVQSHLFKLDKKLIQTSPRKRAFVCLSHRANDERVKTPR